MAILALVISFVGAVEGHYMYQGEQQILSTVRRETVYAGSATGRQRVDELRDDGYSCAAKLLLIQCSKNLTPESLSANYTPQIKQVSFGSIEALNTLYSGDSLLQYEADQSVVVNGVAFNKAMYYEFKDFVKVAAGDSSVGNYYSFFVAKEGLQLIEQKHVRESKWVYKTHLVQSTLQKVD